MADQEAYVSLLVAVTIFIKRICRPIRWLRCTMLKKSINHVLGNKRLYMTRCTVALLVLLCVANFHHIRRIVSQRMYMYGLVEMLHGNPMQSIGTFGFDAVLHEPKLMASYNKKSITLLVLVAANPHSNTSADLRHAIRQTWGNCKTVMNYSRTHNMGSDHVTCVLIFSLGRSLIKGRDRVITDELNKYQDILVGDFIDHYNNLTRKLLFGVNWASKKFRADFILKADDDIYVNIPKLIYLLKTKYGNKKDLYGGLTYYNSVIRDTLHRHYLTISEYPDEWYPPYNKGSQIVMAGELSKKYLLASTQIKRFRLDDAYTGTVMNRIRTLPTRIDEFIQNQYIRYYLYWISSCDIEAMATIGDSLTSAHFFYIHRTIHTKIPWYCVRYRHIFYSLLCLGFIIFIYMYSRCCSRQKVIKIFPKFKT